MQYIHNREKADTTSFLRWRERNLMTMRSIRVYDEFDSRSKSLSATQHDVQTRRFRICEAVIHFYTALLKGFSEMSKPNNFLHIHFYIEDKHE